LCACTERSVAVLGTDHLKSDRRSENRPKPRERVYKATSLVADVALVVVIVVAVTSAPHREAPNPTVAGLQTLAAGTAAPVFTLPRLGGGTSVSLAGFRGSVVVVNFFASWCPHCQPGLPALADLATGAGHVVVVGIDSDDQNLALAGRDLASAGATYPVAIDAKAQVSAQYLLTALPATYFIGADGRVVGAAFGPQTPASLTRWIERATAATTGGAVLGSAPG